MALMASKSLGAAGRISTVVPSASRAYTPPTGSADSASTTGACAGPAAGGAGARPIRSSALIARLRQRADDRRSAGPRVTKPVTYRYHTLNVPYLLDHVMPDDGGLRGTLHGHDPVLHREGEPRRIGQQGVQHDPLGDLVPD